MSWLSLTPASIPALAQAVLGGVVAMYLLLLPHKTSAAWRLTGAMALTFAYLLTLFFRVSVPEGNQAVFFAMEYPLVFAAGALAIGFVYRFLVPMYRTEERFVFGGALAVSVGVTVWFAGALMFQGSMAPLPFEVVGALGGVGALWLPILALRKAATSSGSGSGS